MKMELMATLNRRLGGMEILETPATPKVDLDLPAERVRVRGPRPMSILLSSPWNEILSDDPAVPAHAFPVDLSS